MRRRTKLAVLEAAAKGVGAMLGTFAAKLIFDCLKSWLLP